MKRSLFVELNLFQLKYLYRYFNVVIPNFLFIRLADTHSRCLSNILISIPLNISIDLRLSLFLLFSPQTQSFCFPYSHLFPLLIFIMISVYSQISSVYSQFSAKTTLKNRLLLFMYFYIIFLLLFKVIFKIKI